MATHAHTTPDRRPATPPGTGGRRSLAAGIAALAFVGAGVSRAAPSRDPDADLLRLIKRHIRNHTALNALPDVDFDADNHPTRLAYNATYAAVRTSEPQTMAGVLAKARAAWVEDFVPAEDDEYACDWAALVVRDLLRVVDGAA